MPFYKHLIENDQVKAVQCFQEEQKKHERAAKARMYFALFGGMVSLWIITDYFGKTVSELCGMVGIVWYLLGYGYCRALWDKEKDLKEFRNALIDYDKLHPNQDT